MTKNKRLIAIIVAVSLMFVMISSAIFVIHNVEHDCIGDGCQICAQISFCKQIVKALTITVIALYIAGIVQKQRIKEIRSNRLIVYNNPVFDKIKLLN